MNAIDFLRSELNVPKGLTISVEFVEHDFKRFNVFNIVTGRTNGVEMQEFFNNITGQYFYAAYHADNQRLYIRDQNLAPDGEEA